MRIAQAAAVLTLALIAPLSAAGAAAAAPAGSVPPVTVQDNMGWQ
ncbi:MULTISPECIES: hypothetical protein [unclassified Streptomyces]